MLLEQERKQNRQTAVVHQPPDVDGRHVAVRPRPRAQAGGGHGSPLHRCLASRAGEVAIGLLRAQALHLPLHHIKRDLLVVRGAPATACGACRPPGGRGRNLRRRRRLDRTSLLLRARALLLVLDEDGILGLFDLAHARHTGTHDGAAMSDVRVFRSEDRKLLAHPLLLRGATLGCHHLGERGHLPLRGHPLDGRFPQRRSATQDADAHASSEGTADDIHVVIGVVSRPLLARVGGVGRGLVPRCL
mmetsp:Transcript_18040/g.68409  ORF Transcript_18040/g.68409 Transcript_18040/m.68409 type:complete len:246 (-) Transcript_18040:2310-3047(-)